MHTVETPPDSTVAEIPASPGVVEERPAARLDPTGLMLALGGAFLFSLKPIFIKLNYRYDVDAATQLVLRMGFALPVFMVLAVLALRGRAAKGLATDLSMPTLLRVAGIGWVGYYLASYLDMEGLSRITAQFERLILYTYPTFVAILGFYLFRQRLGRHHAVALALTYGGLASIFLEDLGSLGDQVVSGTLLVLACSLAYALYLLLSKAEIARMGSQLFTCLSMFSGTLFVILHFLVFNDIADLAVPMPVVWYSLGMAIVSTVLPSFMISEAIARVGAGPTSLAGSAGPIFTSFVAVLLLGEAFTWAHAAGTVLVLAGILVLSRERS